jgi:phosphate:Na+ symporter
MGIVLVHLAGAVALLLWGLHMVHTGVVRAFGSDLRRFLNFALRNRMSAFATGLALTAVLQSSTATALMTSSLAADGLIDLMPALAIMLGANVGTTLIVQVLSFNIFVLSPFLIVGGLIAFRSSGRKTRLQQLGRVLIGFGLMILALHLLVEQLSPMETAPAMQAFLKLVTDEPLVCVLLATLLTWIAHSSVATVLLVISLGHSQLIGPEAALAFVLGANLGSAVNPLFESGRSGDLASRRVPIGNFLNRLIGLILVYPFLGPIAVMSSEWAIGVPLLTSSFHFVFNLALALVFIVPLPAISRLLTRLFPEKADLADPGVPLYLSQDATTPAIALSDAARETLRIVDIVETMFDRGMTALLSNDKNAADLLAGMDDVVDRLESSVRLFIAKLTRENLTEIEARRADEIISFALNLEHIGDIIEHSIRDRAIKKIRKNANFSNEGQSEIRELYARVVKSLRLSLSIFVTGDPAAIRLLLQEKTLIRASEREATQNHIIRIREGRSETLETMSMHVDTLRDLKRIHSHICSVAYFHTSQLLEAV